MGIWYFQPSSVYEMLGFMRLTPESTPQLQMGWKTHRDDAHGFSFAYPSAWANFSGEAPEYVEEKQGLSISVLPLEKCVSAEEYIRDNILPYYPQEEIDPIDFAVSNGFVIQRHLDNITPGPEAYVINCPYLIRLGFNPDGIIESDDVFKKIVSSVKTWTPPVND